MNSSDLPPISQPQAASARHYGQAPGKAAQPTQNNRPGDRVELSSQSAELTQLLHKLHQLPEVRTDKIEQARQQIDQGGYDRPEVLEQTIGRMLMEGDLDD